MTLRLSDEATWHVDARLDDGTFDSPDQYLSWSVEREQQRDRAWADLQRQRAEATLRHPEADAIIEATSGRALIDLD